MTPAVHGWMWGQRRTQRPRLSQESMMLVLTLQQNEKIVIGNGEITVQLLAAQAGRVRLGIQAPQDIAVNREAIYLAKQASVDLTD